MKNPPHLRQIVAPSSAREERTWPRCEPASTHFELGASTDYRPTAVMAKRYTPRYGVRKE